MIDSSTQTRSTEWIFEISESAKTTQSELRGLVRGCNIWGNRLNFSKNKNLIQKNYIPLELENPNLIPEVDQTDFLNYPKILKLDPNQTFENRIKSLSAKKLAKLRESTQKYMSTVKKIGGIFVEYSDVNL